LATKNAGKTQRLCVGVRIRLTLEDTPTQSREGVREFGCRRIAARAGALAFRPFAVNGRQGHSKSASTGGAPALAVPSTNSKFAARNSRTRSRRAVGVAPRKRVKRRWVAPTDKFAAENRPTAEKSLDKRDAAAWPTRRGVSTPIRSKARARRATGWIPTESHPILFPWRIPRCRREYLPRSRG